MSALDADRALACPDLEEALRFFRDRLGFRLESIFPADAPRVAVVSHEGWRLRLHEGEDAGLPEALPELAPSFVLSRSGSEAWSRGRAGMLYCDLIPDRQGGRFVASAIRIPEGGPVPDSVHFHDVRLQLIYCRTGWVRVVYEDQGPPFELEAGDCVLQPPGIRHRVLEASPGLEVIELACPAEHLTSLDHELELPTDRIDAEREFGGQRFVRHRASEVPWSPSDFAGFEQRDLGLTAATHGLVSGRALRATGPVDSKSERHEHELRFGFVLSGELALGRGGERHSVQVGDSFVVPAGQAHGFGASASGAELLLVDVARKKVSGTFSGK